MKRGFFDRRIIRHFDWMLLGVALLIPIFGLVVLYSAGYDPDTQQAATIFSIPIRSQVFFKQSIFFLIGVGVLLITLSIPPSVMNRWAYVFYGFCLFLLIVVAVFGLVKKGSQRWIPLGFGFNLQPSEVMKLGVILCLGRYLSKHPPKGKPLTFTQLVIPGLIVAIPMLIIAEQPDLGSALAVAGIGALMILFVGVQPRLLVGLFVLFAAAAPLAWTQLHDYQKRRVMTLLDPDSDPRGSGYHIKQSIIAVGSGELAGKGFMQGTQTQLEFLPEHSTDFIFSVLAEEWGFLGTLTIIALYSTLLYRLLRVVNRSRDLFTAFVAFGVVAAFAVTSIVNIGMVIGLLPVVGIPLPLFSYGGSAMLSMLAALGLALGVSMRRHTFA